MDIPVRYKSKAGYHLLLKLGKSLNAMSVRRLKVPLQNRTVRGLMHNKEKAKSKEDCIVLCMDMMMGIVEFCFVEKIKGPLVKFQICWV